MVHFRIVDAVSRGIKKMVTEQMECRFPIPDYDYAKVSKVTSGSCRGRGF